MDYSNRFHQQGNDQRGIPTEYINRSRGISTAANINAQKKRDITRILNRIRAHINIRIRVVNGRGFC